MSNILIENYRGFDIEFNLNSEKFQCICTDENTKESNSFKSIKTFIDEYIKLNKEFKPFKIVSTPNGWKKDSLTITGIRKDGRFVAENVKGEKKQISDYNLNDYMLFKIENEPLLKQLDELNKLEEYQRKENNKNREEIISKMNIILLSDYKKEIKTT